MNSAKKERSGSPGGRERLLIAAAEVFASQSFAETGIAQILELAKVQAPTLYHHYRDKEGLYVAWATSSMGTVLPHMQHESGLSMEQALRAIMLALAHSGAINYSHVLIEAAKLSRPESRIEIQDAYLRNIKNPVLTAIEKGRSQGQLTTAVPPGLLADLFLAGVYVAKDYPLRSADPVGAATEWWCKTFIKGNQP